MKTAGNFNAKTEVSELEGLLNDAEEWLNNIDFLSDEIRFLKKVIGNYLNNLDEELKERLEQVQIELSRLEIEKQSLRSDIASYLARLELRMNASEQKTDEIPSTENIHQDTQYRYHMLSKLTREFKEHLFSITEDIYGG